MGQLRRGRQDLARHRLAGRRGWCDLGRNPAAPARPGHPARTSGPDRHDPGLGRLDSGVPGLLRHLRPAIHSGVWPERACAARGPHRPGHLVGGRGRLRRHHHLARLAWLPDEAGQRRYRRDSRTDDLRASVRPHRDGQDLPPDPARPGPVPGPVLRAPVLDRDHHAAAPAAVADGAADQGHVLFLRADAGRVRGLGPVRIRLPVGPAAYRAEHRVEDPGFRHRPHPVPAPAARARAGTPAG